MTEVPKIVHNRLRAAALDESQNAAESTHPDANLLAAFAEQSLTAAERVGVLEHLALCRGCRDTVALVLPAEDVRALPIAAESEAVPISQAPKRTPRAIFAWPSLRWAALAAGVVVVGSVLLLRPGKLNQPPANPQIATNAASSTAAGAPRIGTANVGAASRGASALATPSANDNSRDSSNSNEANLVIEAPLSKDAAPRKFTARRTLTPAPQLPAESAMLAAGNKKSSPQADTRANMPAVMVMKESVASETTGAAATQTTEVSAAASELSTTSAEVSVVAVNDAPAIEKAKPALQGTALANGQPASGSDQQQAAGAAATPATTPTIQGRATAKLAMGANPASAGGFAQHDFGRRNFVWAISAGILQRSLDGGQTWQGSLHAERALLCYASYSGEIWAGGQGGALYHSIDAGLTWIQLHPNSEGRQLTSDISRIELRNSSVGKVSSGSKDAEAPSEIVVSTSNKEIWTSADDGKTWKTK